jgi:hemerythrin-like domain-containing protein
MQVGHKKMYADMPDSNPKSKIRDQIDENLKRIYDETLQEEIPDRLTKLLEELRQKSGGDVGEQKPGGKN